MKKIIIVLSLICLGILLVSCVKEGFGNNITTNEDETTITVTKATTELQDDSKEEITDSPESTKPLEETKTEYAEPFDNTITADTKSFVDVAIDTTDSIYLTESTDENIISAKLPVFNDSTIDDLIIDYVCEYFVKTTGTEFDLTCAQDSFDMDAYEYSEYYINTNYNVTYFSDELISITFQGMLNNKTAAHPMHLFFTLNIDRETKQRILFNNNYEINSNLYDIFSGYAKDDIIDKVGEWPEEWGNFSESICSFEKFQREMNDEKTFFAYYTNDGIGISYEVPFALGNHLEVVIPFTEIMKFEKT